MNKAVTDLKPDIEITAPHVLRAINSVMADIAREGIAKDRNNATQGYKFRGIDDVYNALSPILARNSLVITPKCLSRSKEVVTTAKGGTLFYVTVDMEFELASAIDGSTKTAQMFGEAMDSGDKATNKAMSAAYKYMAMQEFCIPTEGDNDADSTTHQLAGAEAMAINLLRGAAAKEWFKDAWDKNKDGWKAVLPADSYARVVAVMKECAAKFTADDAAMDAARQSVKPNAPAGMPADDEIPY